MADFVLRPEDDYRWPPAPAPAILDRETWNAFTTSLAGRVREIEAKRADLQAVLDELSFNAQVRIDGAITPLIAEVRSEIAATQAMIDSVIQDAADAAGAVTEESRARVNRLQADLVAVENRIATILAGGLTAVQVRGLRRVARLDEASLLLDFTLGRLPRRATFTRAGAGTVVDDRGVVRLVPANTPRFDHNPITGEPLGILIEGQNTNLLSRSDDIAGWNRPNTTATANAQLAPDGTMSADLIAADATNTNHVPFRDVNPFPTGPATFSVWMRQAGLQRFRLAFGGASAVTADFDLATGSVSRVSSAAVTAAIVAYPNGWYRCSISTTVDASANPLLRSHIYFIGPDGNLSFAGDGTLGFGIWGAQLETNLFATSYIPTPANATATSPADLLTVPIGDWYNPAEGTIVADYDWLFGAGVAGFNHVFSLSDGTAGNNIGVRMGASPAFLSVSAAGTTVAAMQTGTYGTPMMAVAGWRKDNFILSVNGSDTLLDATGEIPQGITALKIGRQFNDGQLMNGRVRGLAYLPKCIANGEAKLRSARTP